MSFGIIGDVIEELLPGATNILRFKDGNPDDMEISPKKCSDMMDTIDHLSEFAFDCSEHEMMLPPSLHSITSPRYVEAIRTSTFFPVLGLIGVPKSIVSDQFGLSAQLDAQREIMCDKARDIVKFVNMHFYHTRGETRKPATWIPNQAEMMRKIWYRHETEYGYTEFEVEVLIKQLLAAGPNPTTKSADLIYSLLELAFNNFHANTVVTSTYYKAIHVIEHTVNNYIAELPPKNGPYTKKWRLSVATNFLRSSNIVFRVFLDTYKLMSNAHSCHLECPTVAISIILAALFDVCGLETYIISDDTTEEKRKEAITAVSEKRRTRPAISLSLNKLDGQKPSDVLTKYTGGSLFTWLTLPWF